MIVRVVVLDRHVAAVGVAHLIQALLESRHLQRRRIRRCVFEKSNHRHRRLLRTRGEWPCWRTAKCSDKLAPPHSITSSAINNVDWGMVSPSALAVFRLITNSYLVGVCTGKSDGFSPLRMRSTYDAAPRKISSKLRL